jgi:hypothetical protein
MENFNFDKLQCEFTIETKIGLLSFQIENVSTNQIVANLDDALIFKTEKNKNIAVYFEQDTLNVSVSQNDLEKDKLIITFKNIQDVAFKPDLAFIYFSEDKFIKVKTVDCKIASFTNNKLVVIYNSLASHIKIFDHTENEVQAFLAIEEGGGEPTPRPFTIVGTVPPGSRTPEYTLSILDYDIDLNKYIPRPIRLGVPVISTVPAYDSNLTGKQLVYFSDGKGPQSRTIYFKAQVQGGGASGSPLKLLIYLPNGVDTLTVPDYTWLTYDVDEDAWLGSYTFYEEDTIYSVDGYAYFKILELSTQQISLSLQIDESPTTSDNFIISTNAELY